MEPNTGDQFPSEPTADRVDAEHFWEDRYATKIEPTVGSINFYLVEMLGHRTPGTALELGCSQGADVIWLASNGWMVTGIDIAQTAVDRAMRFADEAGVADRTSFERRDLAVDFPSGIFDVVYAHFFHTPEDFPRAEVLRGAARVVAPGGMLLLVDHGSVPSWGPNPNHQFPSPHETLASLELDPARWSNVRVEAVERMVNGPDGQSATILDNIIAVERLAG